MDSVARSGIHPISAHVSAVGGGEAEGVAVARGSVLRLRAWPCSRPIEAAARADGRLRSLNALGAYSGGSGGSQAGAAGRGGRRASRGAIERGGVIRGVELGRSRGDGVGGGVAGVGDVEVGGVAGANGEGIG